MNKRFEMKLEELQHEKDFSYCGDNIIDSQYEKNVDPRKWICVEAEKTIVKQSGNIIVLIMTFEDIADAVATNFIWSICFFNP